MGRIADRLHELGLTLPPPLAPPAGVVLPFAPAIVSGDRVVFSGHGPQAGDGSVAGPLGKVGADVTIDEAYAAARLAALSVLGSLERTLGDLDRISGWTRVFGMVNSAPGFTMQPAVINGFSDLVLEVFGTDVGAHTRSAVGMAELPFDIPVEVEGEARLASAGPQSVSG
jgi:enamine deaminase RidA (YjgF/YER057c/UK114 family)